MSTRPTLFILSNMREFGGAERSIAALLPALARSARLHVFVANEQHFRELLELRLPGLNLIRVPAGSSPWALARSLLILARCHLRERPAALLANGHKGGLLLALLRWLLPWSQFEAAVYVRDFDYYTLPFILRSLPRARYFAPTQAIFDSAPYVKWGLSRRTCAVLPNAVPRAHVAAPLTVAEPFFACCARITPWKGIDLLIRALPLVLAEQPGARLRVYGEIIDPPYFASLQQLACDLGVEHAVRFEPFTPDIAAVYAAGAFFVVPSRSTPPGPESFCRIIIEAWAHAKPTVSFATGGPKTLIRHGVDGLLVPEGDLRALAQSITSLLAEPERCAALGQAGAARLAHEFSPEAIATELLAKLLPPAAERELGKALSEPAPAA